MDLHNSRLMALSEGSCGPRLQLLNLSVEGLQALVVCLVESHTSHTSHTSDSTSASSKRALGAEMSAFA